MSWSFTVPGQPVSWNHAYKPVNRRAKDGRTFRGQAKTPKPKAPIEEHKKIAEEFLKDPMYATKPETLDDKSDEAKP